MSYEWLLPLKLDTEQASFVYFSKNERKKLREFSHKNYIFIKRLNLWNVTVIENKENM